MIEVIGRIEALQSVAQPQCPLCWSISQIELVSDLDVQRLISRWQDTYQIDTANDFGDWQTIGLYCCRNCQLLFYSPFVAGSERLYSELQRHEWYYMSNKWEFQAALQDLRPGSHCLEVGCGTGSYIRLAIQHGINAEGVELNASAVQKALEFNLPVSNKDIADLVRDKPGSYDAICVFQVLEHVAELRSFLENCISMLKESGLLILSVPNEGGFLHLDADNLLNQPPHHVSRWTRRTLSKLQSLFPLQLIRIAYEPLAAYHLDWYISTQQGRFPYHNHIGKILRNGLGVIFNNVLIPTKMYHYLRGHTMYACFRKTAQEFRL